MRGTSDLPGRAVAATIAATAVSAATAVPALAHVGSSESGLVSGLSHPITGVDHLLAMVAVGIVAVAGSRPRPAWLPPAAFLGGMLAGGVGGLAGVPLPGAEHLILGSVVLLGLVVAGALQGTGRWVVPTLVLAGIAHGHAHGAEAPSTAHPALYVLGFLAATATLHLTGVGVGTVIRDRRLVRVGLGAATVTAGALLVL